MRVTEQMIVSRSTANLSTSIDRLMRLQTQMSSGRRLEHPSDDPSGVSRALSLRASMDSLDQYQANVGWSKTQLATVEQVLNSANTLLVSGREIATALANDNYDAAARRGAAQEAQSLLDQLLQLGNTQKEGLYLFSGHQTRTQTFLGGGNGVVFQGDHGSIYSQVESASQMGINLIGSDLFLSPLQVLGEGFDLNRGVAAAVPLADLHHGAGVNLSPGTIQFTDENSGLAMTVDLSAAATAGDVIAAINTQLAAGGMNGVAASVSASGNALHLSAANNGLISTVTRLANLHNGAGVDLSPGTFRVATDDNSVDVTINLNGATTIGDVIAAFDAEMAAAGVANVTMSVNAAQTGLRITDANGTPLGLKVVDLSEKKTALNLGLSGYVNAELVGSNLDPQRTITVAETGPGQTTAADLGIKGTFSRSLDGADLDPILTAATPVAELQDGRGLSLGQIRLSQGVTSAVVNLSTAVTVGDIIARINASGLSVTASLNAAGKGIQIVPTTSDQSLMVEEADGTRSAHALGIDGSPDLTGSMMLLVRALENNDRDMVGRLLGPLEKAADHILDARAAVGAKIRRLDTTSERLTDVGTLMKGLLSDIEDADIVNVTTQLATQQNIYQAALNAVSRVILPSLVDFVS